MLGPRFAATVALHFAQANQPRNQSSFIPSRHGLPVHVVVAFTPLMVRGAESIQSTSSFAGSAGHGRPQQGHQTGR
jgi:hypothetical protein